MFQDLIGLAVRIGAKNGGACTSIPGAGRELCVHRGEGSVSVCCSGALWAPKWL